MKKVSFKKQEDMLKDVIVNPFTTNINDQEIEINPIASISQKRDFVETVWNFVYSTDADGLLEYRPYMLEPAIRLMTLYVYTNIAIDTKNPMEKQYNLIMYSNVYETVVSCLHDTELIGRDYDDLVESTKEYIEYKRKEISDYRAMYAKNSIDTLLENILTQASTILEKFSANDSNFDMKDVSNLISYFQNMKNDKSMIDGVLDFALKNKKASDANEVTKRTTE